MTDLSKNTPNNNSEKEQVFDNNKENRIISDTLNTKENIQTQERHKKDSVIENQKDKKDDLRQKDITSNNHPEIEVNGTYRIPWEWIIGGILILSLIGIAIYFNNTNESSENIQQDTMQSTNIEQDSENKIESTG